MAKHSDSQAGAFDGEAGGAHPGLLSEEDELDNRALWRLGAWAAGAVGAVVIAMLANQSSLGMRREMTSSSDFARQAQQIQLAVKDSQNEARRLASVVETLNEDRDRLFSRMTVIEQGLDSVTGAIARQAPSPSPQPQASVPPASASSPSAASPPPAAMASIAAAGPVAGLSAEPAPVGPKPQPAPAVSPAEATVAAVTEKPAPKMPEVTASVSKTPEDEAASDAPSAAGELAIKPTEFGVDVGGANSMSGLRALWRGLLKSRANTALASLRPIILIKENSNGLGMQLRLLAGPIGDAAAAAKICATLTVSGRNCTTAVFEGQRLALNADEQIKSGTAAASEAKPGSDATPETAPKTFAHKRAAAKRPPGEEPPEPPSILSLIFGRR